VLAQHSQPVADGGQIELRVGDFQFIDENEERIGARSIDLQIKLRAAVREQLALGVSVHGDDVTAAGGAAASVIDTVAEASSGPSVRRALNAISP
jgi:hypothetical protein